MTLTTTTATLDTISKRFAHWLAVPQLSSYLDLTELRQDYERQAGNTVFFSPENIRFFGGRNGHLAAPGIYVETQTRAPETVGRYSVTAWVHGNGRLQPIQLARFDTLARARWFAQQASACWPELAGRPAA